MTIANPKSYHMRRNIATLRYTYHCGRSDQTVVTPGVGMTKIIAPMKIHTQPTMIIHATIGRASDVQLNFFSFLFPNTPIHPHDKLYVYILVVNPRGGVSNHDICSLITIIGDPYRVCTIGYRFRRCRIQAKRRMIQSPEHRNESFHHNRHFRS